MAKAIQSGIAVRASEKLWMVSASRATELEISTTPSWRTAVIPSATNEILTARIPRALLVSASSTESAGSWLWPTIDARNPVMPP